MANIKKIKKIMGKGTKITKGNVHDAIKDDKDHIEYLKEDVDKDQKYGGKHKDENQTADEKHISKLAGDIKHDHTFISKHMHY
tara:strand:+ start:197 stop:445 length:249 start_codon:yes stop_codon:yes gene_type:complete